jgi:hypothetical protein
VPLVKVTTQSLPTAVTDTPDEESTVWTHAPEPTVAAFAGDDGATVRIESKSVPIDMYAKDFFGRKTA